MLLVEGSWDTDHAQREEGVKIPGDSHKPRREAWSRSFPHSPPEPLSLVPGSGTSASSWAAQGAAACCLWKVPGQEAAIKGLMS